jgi:aspartate/methionine/tyrosine aminotransferase
MGGRDKPGHDEKKVNPLFANLPTTVFTVMSGLAAEHGAINLGQGFPDNEGPEDVRAAAAEALMHASNQYPPMQGLPALREAVAEHYRRFQGLDLDWKTQVLVTSGATEALAATIMALLAPGDEAVLLEPAYDSYAPQARAVGGVPRFVRLEPPGWRITREALEKATTSRTKIILFNNPLNPAARVYSAEELKVLADWCVAHDVIAVCDEVWEHVVFDNRAHVPLYGLPGMAERCVKIGSAGKIFSLTGWKVGWACAPPALAAVIGKAHQFLTFTTPPNLQTAVAYGLGKDDAYFEAMRASYARSRDRLTAGLQAEGFNVIRSEGTYFLNIDLPASGIDADDETFCRRAVTEAGVAAIPVSAFYETDPVRTVARLCFAKADETLDAGIERLAKARRLF